MPTPVRSWSTPSSDPDEGDHITTLWSDGSMTCSPCKGFQYSRDGKPKACKHTKRYALAGIDGR